MRGPEPLPAGAIDERVLVLAPVGRDGELTRKVLADAGIPATRCDDVAALTRELAVGAGALVVAEEALTERAVAALVPALAAQPTWSDIPLLVIADEEASHDASMRTLARVQPLGQVTLLDRPVRIISLISAVQVAIRARKRQYQARDLLARLREGVEQRDRFLAMLGHELRNPLAAIVYAARLVPPDAAARPRAVIERQAAHLSRLVDELLDVSRVTSGKITLQRAHIDLCALVVRCIESLQPSAGGLRLEVVGCDKPLVVDVDPVRMEQVVMNLLTNAVKYTPSSGHVWISVQREEGSRMVRLVVEDDGVGIPKAMLPRVFDLFTQVDKSLDRSRGGLGIGLTVVRSIIELHGGTVHASSEGEGRGSRFEVRVPLTEAVGAEASQRADGHALASQGARRRRILIVEDDDDIRESLQFLLESEGHSVDAASNGDAAIAQVKAAPPEIALVDIGLPGMSGYEVARAIRDALGSKIYLAALTGYGQPDDRARAQDAGFDVHLTKPVDVDKVERLVREAPPR